MLRAAFAQAVRWGWVDRNPIERATPPHVNRHEIEPPAIEDVLRVLERAGASRNPENALVFRLLAATGCRRGEVCGLQWQDVDFDSEPVQVLIRRAVIEIEKKLVVQGTKTHAVRNVGLDQETSQLLRAHWATAVEVGLAAGVPSTATTSSSSASPAPSSRCRPTASARHGGASARMPA